MERNGGGWGPLRPLYCRFTSPLPGHFCPPPSADITTDDPSSNPAPPATTAATTSWPLTAACARLCFPRRIGSQSGEEEVRPRSWPARAGEDREEILGWIRGGGRFGISPGAMPGG
ncbi:hypothetical protein NL676_000232 [Syzygium grande]|nr:hypothetical protein NL676_000232 [Syzygium grande]